MLPKSSEEKTYIPDGALFKERVNAQQLSSASDFETLAQAAIESYYHQPYLDGSSSTQPDTVKRRLHGGIHATERARGIETNSSLT